MTKRKYKNRKTTTTTQKQNKTRITYKNPQ